MNAGDIMQALNALDPEISLKARFGGANYAKPTWEWVMGAFKAWYQKQLFNWGVDRWAVKWECRDFARACACLMQVCNADTSLSPGSIDILAVAEIWFVPDTSRGMPAGEGHAINLVITENGIQFFDPQNFLEWKMLPTELASCYFLRF